MDDIYDIEININNGEKKLLKSLMRLQKYLDNNKIRLTNTIGNYFSFIPFTEYINEKEYNGRFLLRLNYHDELDNYFNSNLEIIDDNGNKLYINYFFCFLLPGGELTTSLLRQEANIEYEIENMNFSKQYYNEKYLYSKENIEIEKNKILKRKFCLSPPTRWNSNYKEYHLTGERFTIDKDNIQHIFISKNGYDYDCYLDSVTTNTLINDRKNGKVYTIPEDVRDWLYYPGGHRMKRIFNHLPGLDADDILAIQEKLKKMQENKVTASKIEMSNPISFYHDDLLELASRLTAKIESLNSEDWQEIKSSIKNNHSEYKLKQYKI